MTLSRRMESLMSAMDGEVWQIEAEGDLFQDLYHRAPSPSLEVSNQVCKCSWTAQRGAMRALSTPTVHFQDTAELFLSNGPDSALVLERKGQTESIKMTFRPSLALEPLIFTAASSVKNITPAIPCADHHTPCECEGCAEKQCQIRKHPRVHPLFSVLERISRSEKSYFFQINGAQLAVSSLFTPQTLRVTNGICHLFSQNCVLTVDLTEVFHISVAQEQVDEDTHAVLEGRDKELNTAFRILSADKNQFFTWARLIEQGAAMKS